MTPAALLRCTSIRFRDAGIPDPETDSALLLSYVYGGAPLALRLDTETELPPEILTVFSRLAERRLAREPLQYITSEAPFFGRFFYVDSRVLIPRPETELLCSWVLECLPPGADCSVLDLCCGSGCIGLTLAAERPSLRITLSDISSDALQVASRNADRLGIRAALHQGDLTAGFQKDSFDCIVSNPPYIPTAECPDLQPEVLCEPVAALDGGNDGLSFYRRIADEASFILKNNGLLFLELGYGEADAVSDILSSAGFIGIKVREDFNGVSRMMLAVSSTKEELCSKN